MVYVVIALFVLLVLSVAGLSVASLRLSAGHVYWRKRALIAEELLWYYDEGRMKQLHGIGWEDWRRKWGVQ